MNELGYYPNSVARSLRSKKSFIIGLIVPDITNFFFTGIIGGIQKVLQTNGYRLILSNSDEDLENEKEQIKIYNSQLIDGLIIAPTTNDHSFLSDFLGNYPVVFIDRKPEGYKGDCVLINNTEVVYEAISYLIKKGHKRIGMITGLEGLTTTEERFLGYKKALTDYGISIDEKLIKKGNSRYDSGYKLTEKLLNEDITALFVANNLMTVGSIECLKKNNVKIPDDLALIGFDDYIWSSVFVPELSVIRQPAKKIGKKAAEVLLERINEEQIDRIEREYRLNAEFIPSKLIK